MSLTIENNILMKNGKPFFYLADTCWSASAWMNDHVEEKMRATVFSTSGQLDSFGQIIGGPIVGLVAQQVSIPWGLVCTAFLLLPALFLVPVAGKKRD